MRVEISNPTVKCISKGEGTILKTTLKSRTRRLAGKQTYSTDRRNYIKVKNLHSPRDPLTKGKGEQQRGERLYFRTRVSNAGRMQKTKNDKSTEENYQETLHER